MLSSSVCQGPGPAGFREEPSLLLPDLPQEWPLLTPMGLGDSFLHGLSKACCQELSREQRISPYNKTKRHYGLSNSLMGEFKLC